ncbi:MAG: hypothetical protein P9M08_02600, partial [Candidatus Erginobacter occultus]|nr:hypothetical protein [Candidatus Erginobacter occultus]
MSPEPSPISEEQVRSIVQTVVARLAGGEAAAPGSPPSPIALGDGVYSGIEEAIAAGTAAQKKLMTLNLAVREKIIEAMRQAGWGSAEKISLLVVSETGMGRVDSKIQKHLLVSNKTPGLEDLQPIAW